jgi:hypothetical protein
MRLKEFTEALAPADPQVQAVQDKLKSQGYELGPTGADGRMGPFTREAVRAYQTKNNLKVDGRIGPETLGSLGLATSTPNPKDTAVDQDKNTGNTVCIFKGMSHGSAGNQACDAIAQATGGKTWGPLESSSAAQSAAMEAAQYFQSRPGTKLVIMGYSMGVSSLLALQRLKPALTIAVAGWSTTVERLDQAAQGEYHNFYDPAELNGQLKKLGRKYTPQGGHAHALNLGANSHNKIVPQVAGQVIALIGQV